MLMIFYMNKKVTSHLIPKCELIYEEKLGLSFSFMLVFVYLI